MNTIVFLGLVAIVAAPVTARAADPDWKMVEQALGKSGQLQSGDVFRIGMPRTDLAVTVKGVPTRRSSKPLAARAGTSESASSR